MELYPYYSMNTDEENTTLLTTTPAVVPVKTTKAKSKKSTKSKKSPKITPPKVSSTETKSETPEVSEVKTRVCVVCNLELNEDKYHVSNGRFNSASCKICRNVFRRSVYPKKVAGFKKLSQEKQTAILDDLEAGLSDTKTANRNGVNQATLSGWKRKGWLVRN
jgi:hypothetical protein